MAFTYQRIIVFHRRLTSVSGMSTSGGMVGTEWVAFGWFALIRPMSARHGADVIFLHGIASRMAAEVPFDEVLNEVVDFATSVVKCDSCFVYLLEGDELVLRASKNSHPEAVGKLKLKLGQGITGWVAKHRQPVVVAQNAALDPRFQLLQRTA